MGIWTGKEEHRWEYGGEKKSIDGNMNETKSIDENLDGKKSIVGNLDKKNT